MGEATEEELSRTEAHDNEVRCAVCKGSGRIIIMMPYSTTPPWTGCSACGGSGLAKDTTPESVARALAMFED